MLDTPNFGEWQRQPLVDKATEMYTALQKEREANEQLRIDLKDAMKVVRELAIQTK